MADFEQFGSAASRDVSDGVHGIENAAKHMIDRSKARVNDAVDMAASRVEDAHAFVTRQAREKPVQTTAIAVGAGLLAGLFMASGRRR